MRGIVVVVVVVACLVSVSTCCFAGVVLDSAITRAVTCACHSNVVVITTGATTLGNLTDPYKVDYEVR